MTTKTNATPDNATHLLGAAAALGLSKYVVQVKFGNLVAPDEVFEKAGFTLDEESGFAFYGEPETRTATKKVAAKEVTAEAPTKAKAQRKAPAKRAAKKTTTKTAAPAEKE